MDFKKLFPKSRLMWLLGVLISLLALPFGVQAQDWPENVTYSNITTSSLTMSWDVVDGATGYEYIRRLPSDGPVQSIAGGSTSTITISGLGSATFYGFQLRTVVGNQKSNWTPVNTQYTKPKPPRNLRTICVAGTTTQVAWDAPDLSDRNSVATPPLNYEIKINNGNWQAQSSSRGRLITQLALNTTYTFRVRALLPNAIGDETSAQVTTEAVHIEPPTNLQTSDITSSSITLTWNASTTSTVTAYEVSSDGGATWVDSGSDLTHSFTSLNEYTSYRLRVRAKSATANSCPVIAEAAKTLSNSPTGLSTSGITQTAITLSWTKVNGVTAYKVRKDTDSWATLGDVATHQFTGLTADTTYSLQVLAVHQHGDSDIASTSAKTLINVPAAPSGLATSGITETGITLSWTKSATATAYKVRKASGDSWTTLGDVATYNFTGLSAGTSYSLQVLANNAGGDSASVSIDASTLPVAPTGLATSGITQTAITLSWTKSTGATAYKVRKGTDSWTTLGDVATYTFSGLDANTAYTLQVLASNAGGDSASASSSATTLPNAPSAPTSLTTSGISQTGITLAWTKATGATAYKVRKGTDSWTTLGDVATYNFTGLSAGTSYSLQVLASNAGGDSAAASIDASTLPAVPTGLTTSGITQTSITLNWTKSTGATGYQVNGGALTDWTTLGDVATYTFTGLTANTQYTVQVRAQNTGGTSSAASSDATTLPDAPGAPTGLTTSGISQTSITLNWTKPAGGTGYQVNGGALSAWTNTGDVATYTFTGLSANTQYTLQLRSLNSGGNSGAVSAAAKTLPNSPSSPTTSAVTNNSIKLSWTASAGGADSYEVSSDSSTWVDSGGSDTEHTFSGLDADTAYTLQVRAKNSSGVSAAVSAAARTLVNPPGTPTSLSTSGITQTAITLNWTKHAEATGYQVNGGTLSAWTNAGDVATYEFTGLSANTQYTLQVRAQNQGGNSSAVSTATKTLPNAPTSPSTSAITNNSIKLSWTASVGGADSYEVSSDSSTWVDSGGSDTEHTFSGLDADTAYTLQVRAKNSAGVSTAVSVAARTLANAPAAPTGLTTSGITQSAITLSWTKSTGATAYKVRKDSGDSWTTLGDVATYTFSSLTLNTQYTLQVIANNAGGDSAAASINARTLPNAPAAPTGLSSSGITQTSITLSWTKSTGATAYKVRTGTTGSFTVLGDVATYTFTGLTANTAYTLQVLASNAGGDSSTAQISATTNNVPPPATPAAPTGLSTSGITQTAITLDWTKSTGATAYTVRIDTDFWTPLGDVATYTFSGLTADTAYSLEVLASNDGGDSASASINARTLPNLPAAPTSLSASNYTPTSITLGWTKSTGATAYKVRKDSGDSWTILGDVATYQFTGLTANTQYTLEVVANNAGGDSAAASINESTLPAMPIGLTTSGITQTAITLSWTKSTGATGYDVQGGTLNSWTDVGDVDTYTFSGLTVNTQYDLIVRAKNSDGTTAGASITTRTLTQQANALASPSGVNTSGITKTAITLNWTKVSDATSYEVDGGVLTGWTDIGDVAAYTFSGLDDNTQYSLQVRAKDSQRTSVSVSVTAQTLLNVNAPQNLRASEIEDTQVTLQWSDPVEPQSLQIQAAMNYQVRGGMVSSWTNVGGVNSYIFVGLSPNTRYNLQVRAHQSNVYSPPAEVLAQTRSPLLGSPGQGSQPSQPSQPSAPSGGAGAEDTRDSSSSTESDTFTEPSEPIRSTGPAFNCNDEQKAMISISPQPPGLNVQCVGPNGVGDPGVVARGVVLGVDVWGWVRDFEVCFKPAGAVVFLDASFSPRRLTEIGLYSRAGMTCAQLARPGTLVLLSEPASDQPPATAPDTSSPAATVSNCQVQTLDNINFRATPGGQIIVVLGHGLTLTVYEKQGDWYNADFFGQRGWLHADSVSTIGDCG